MKLPEGAEHENVGCITFFFSHAMIHLGWFRGGTGRYIKKVGIDQCLIQASVWLGGRGEGVSGWVQGRTGVPGGPGKNFGAVADFLGGNVFRRPDFWKGFPRGNTRWAGWV